MNADDLAALLKDAISLFRRELRKLGDAHGCKEEELLGDIERLYVQSVRRILTAVNVFSVSQVFSQVSEAVEAEQQRAVVVDGTLRTDDLEPKTPGVLGFADHFPEGSLPFLSDSVICTVVKKKSVPPPPDPDNEIEIWEDNAADFIESPAVCDSAHLNVVSGAREVEEERELAAVPAGDSDAESPSLKSVAVSDDDSEALDDESSSSKPVRISDVAFFPRLEVKLFRLPSFPSGRPSVSKSGADSNNPLLPYESEALETIPSVSFPHVTPRRTAPERGTNEAERVTRCFSKEGHVVPRKKKEGKRGRVEASSSIVMGQFVRCPHCPLRFGKGGQGLEPHLEKDHGIAPAVKLPTGNKCPDCGREYSNQSSMRSHFKKEHIVLPPEPEPVIDSDERYLGHEVDGDVKWDTLKDLLDEGDIVEDEDEDVLDEEFSLESSSGEAVKYEKLEGDEFPCPDCGRIFYRYFFMRKHCISEHGRTLPENADKVCPVCKFQFVSTTVMKNHMKSAHGPKKGKRNRRVAGNGPENADAEVSFPRFPCTQCERVLVSELALKMHMRGSHGPKKKSESGFGKNNSKSMKKDRMEGFRRKRLCADCGKEFFRIDTLRRHVLSVHNHGKSCYTCGKCGATFRHSASYYLHKKRHLKTDVRYYCEVCGKSYRSTGSLKYHSIVHSSKETHQCPWCPGKVFLAKERLQKHVQSSHPDHRRLHPCDICAKSLGSADSLRKHLERCHPVSGKPFSCDTCKRGFQSEELLLKHQKIHTAPRPFECDRCPAKFFRKDVMRRHMRTHDKVRIIPCESCGASFQTLQTYREHLHLRKCVTLLAI